MPRIVAYHPEILVETADAEVVAIKIDLDDWYSDADIMRSLAEETGARTAGGLVEALRRSGSARIDKVVKVGSARVYGWDDAI